MFNNVTDNHSQPRPVHPGSSHVPSAGTIILVVGLCSAGIQTVFVREYLSVFSGNELVLGIILGVWLLASGVGSLAGVRAGEQRVTTLIVCILVSASAALPAIRASRLLWSPGETPGPLRTVAIVILTEGPVAFCCGYTFGSLSRRRGSGNLYCRENAGNVLGALIVFGGILAGLPNSILAAVLIAPFALLSRRSPPVAPAVVVAVVTLALSGRTTVQWKYPGKIADVRYGREGELARIVAGPDTSLLLNGTLYRTTIEEPALEQAVHIPMANHAEPSRVLVMFDRGHTGELAAYRECTVETLESEPLLAGPTTKVVPPERYRPSEPFDVILLGTGLPNSVAVGRFYTVTFFTRMKKIMAADGVVSFTLPLSTNYLSPSEAKLCDILRATLTAVFDTTVVFPGVGLTFSASDSPLRTQPSLRVETNYLDAFVLPGVDEARIAKFNRPISERTVNRTGRPAALLTELSRWIELYGVSSRVLLSATLAAALLVIVLLPKTREVLSVGTSGLVTGAYSVCLLLLYQSNHGALYSRIAPLLVALTLGFVLGSRVKRFPHSDPVIGAYAAGSLILLAWMPFPAAWLFYVFHALAGALSGAQFVTRREGQGVMYAADVLGGVFGMVLCSTLLVPLAGVVNVALGMGTLKALVWPLCIKE